MKHTILRLGLPFIVISLTMEKKRTPRRILFLTIMPPSTILIKIHKIAAETLRWGTLLTILFLVLLLITVYRIPKANPEDELAFYILT